MRKPYNVLGEHVFSVVDTQPWDGGGFQPGTGKVFVGAQVQVKALSRTAPGDFSVFDSAGVYYASSYVAPDPELDWEKPLAPGQTIDGWIAFAVPAARAGSLTLVYHVHAGAGPTVLVPLRDLRL
jgi:hypothetical protein